jgi:putative transposase
VEKKTTVSRTGASRAVWTGLETMVREHVQGYIQRLLEEEVEDFLGRSRYERKSAVDPEPGYRNGHGRPRRLTLSCGTIEVRRPRVRDLDERFESALLPFFARRTREVNALLPELYLHGLAAGDMDLALRGLLGGDAPISAATVARLKAGWQRELDEWSSRSLAGLEVAYLWVDGVYVKAGLEKEKAAILVALAGLSDGRKVVVGLRAGYRESTEGWRDFLADLKGRGMNAPRLVIGDGHLGIWGALRDVWPGSREQRCWNHRIVNVLDKLPKKAWPEARRRLRAMSYANTEEEALALRGEFQRWCRALGHAEAADLIEEDWEKLVAYYRFPKEHWGHLRTTNPVESPFSSVRIRTDAARRFKRVANATAVVWKTLAVAQRRFRKLTAPELCDAVFRGAVYLNGVVQPNPEKGTSQKGDAA